MATLIIIPCGISKVWDKDPDAGPTEARDAYTGLPFQLARWYAEKNASYWMILSAKYGLIRPDFLIPENYDVTFNDPGTRPYTAEEVKEQVAEMQLDRFETVIGLGGAKYRQILAEAFGDRTVEFPFAGLPIGKMNQAIKKSIDADAVPAVPAENMLKIFANIQVGVAYPRPDQDLNQAPTHFIPSWKFETFRREVLDHPQIYEIEDREMDTSGVVYATFVWDPDLGMDISAYVSWAEAELQAIMVKYMVPIYQEKWND